MASNYVLNVNVQLSPGGSLSNSDGYAIAVDNLGRFPTNSTTLKTGSSVQQSNTWAIIASTIAPSSYMDIDLTNQTNLFGGVNFTNVKIVCFAVNQPDGSLYANVARSPTNGWTGIPNDTDVLNNNYYRENIFGGWDVNGTNKNIRLSNPTASAIQISGFICGVM